MKWAEFEKGLKAARSVTLIGPFYGRPYAPAGPTIYVDSGVQFRPQNPAHRFVDISVGDGDSSKIALDETLPVDKDISDLGYVLEHLPAHVGHVELLGFLGGRRDHELLNFGEIHHFLKDAQSFRSARFDDLVIAFNGGKLSQEIHGTFSVVVFEPSYLTLTGSCKFTTEKPMRLSEVSSHGLSNIGFGTVLIECTVPCFVFL